MDLCTRNCVFDKWAHARAPAILSAKQKHEHSRQNEDRDALAVVGPAPENFHKQPLVDVLRQEMQGNTARLYQVRE